MYKLIKSLGLGPKVSPQERQWVTQFKKSERFQMSCDCYKTERSKCQSEDHLSNKCAMQVLKCLYPYIRSCREVQPRLMRSLVYYDISPLEMLLRGSDNATENCISVEMTGCRDRWLRCFLEAQFSTMEEIIRSAGLCVSNVSFDMFNHSLDMIVVTDKRMDVVVESGHWSFGEVPLVSFRKLNGVTKIIFILVVVSDFGTYVKALPDYVSESDKKQSNVILTYYWVDYPGDFKRSGRTLEFGSCSGETFGSADVSFLRNMALDGTGYFNGTLYNLGDCDCHGRYYCFMEVDKQKCPYGLTDDDNCLVPFVSVAANDLDKGLYYIPQIDGWKVPGSNKKHNGCVRIEDSSWSFDEKHLDLFVYRMKYYGIWDDKYNSPNVDIYKADDCPILDYMGNSNGTDAEHDDGDTCVCANASGGYASASGATSTIAKPTATKSISLSSAHPTSSLSKRAVSTVPIPTPTFSDINGEFDKRFGFESLYSTPNFFEKRGSVANVPSCSGYNCFPVHVLLIVTIVVVGLIPIFSYLLRYRVYRIHIYAMILLVLYVIGVCIYCIIALKSEGPVKIAIIDQGVGNKVKRMFEELYTRDTFELSYACKNHEMHYYVTCGVGGLCVLFGILLLIRERRKAKWKIYKNYTYEAISFITFGITLSVLSVVVIMAYQKCFKGDHLKLLCNIGGHLFWGSVAATIVSFALLIAQTILQFCSLSVFLARINILKPIMVILFAVSIIVGMGFLDANACFG